MRRALYALQARADAALPWRTQAPSAPSASGFIDANKSIQEAAEIDEEYVFKEIEILKSLDHPAVLKMMEYFIGAREPSVKQPRPRLRRSLQR